MREELEIREDRDGFVYWIEGPTPRDRPLHSHAELELNLVVRGRAEYLVDGTCLKLERGSLLWLYPSQAHTLSTSSGDLGMWVFVFRPRMLEVACRTESFSQLRGSEPCQKNSVQLFPQAFAYLESLCVRSYRALEVNVDLFNGSVRYLLLTAWKETLEHEADLESRTLHPGVFRAAMTLCRDPAIGSLSDLAQEVGMSSEHLSRLFKQQMGQSLSDFRNDQRLRRFTEVYGSGQRLNLLQATIEAGFGSYTQFYRIHLKKTGKPPSSLKR